MNRPDTINLFRMVHFENVPYILEHGMCCREHPKADPNYINIGHRQLISDRHQFEIPIPGAGYLGDYVPFYFAGHSPMLLMIKNGTKGVEKRPQNDIVYIVSTVDKIVEQNLPFVFTDRNAKISVAEFYRDLEDLDKLDWQIIRSRYWANDESNLARQDLKQAEFLVHKHVPVSSIHFIVVKTLERKQYFDEIVHTLGLGIPIYVDKDSKLYY